MTPAEQPALVFPVSEVPTAKQRDSITAPEWETQPLAWYCWYLTEHPEIYKEFRKIADEGLRQNPTMALSSDRILHVIRWQTDLKGEGDRFKINDHLTALFARLYVLERPEHEGKFRNRKSFLDSLDENEKERLLLAFEPLRLNRRRLV